MEAGLSLREVFAELSRGGGGDPAELLRAAGYGDVPEPLVTQAIIDYAGTAPVEVAEHLSPFAVAHGPVPVDEPAGGTPAAHHGLSLLASAPVVDHPDHPDHTAPDHGGPDDVEHEPVGHHVVDVDPSALDGDPVHPVHPVHPIHPVHPTHPEPVSFGTGHGGTGHGGTGHDGAGHDAHHAETSPSDDHVQDVDAYDQDVSHHDVVHDPAPDDDASTHLGHDLGHDALDAADHDPVDLDGDEPHHV